MLLAFFLTNQFKPLEVDIRKIVQLHQRMDFAFVNSTGRFRVRFGIGGMLFSKTIEH